MTKLVASLIMVITKQACAISQKLIALSIQHTPEV